MNTGKDLAELAKEAHSKKCGYIWGTSGQIWSKSDQQTLCRNYTANPTKYANYANAVRYGDRWIGYIVYDCSGLTMALAKKLGVSIAHGSNSQWKSCVNKGALPCAGLPIGALVFKLRNTTDYYHVGIYIGENRVIEAQGTQTGVVISSLTSWTHYGLIKGISYDAEEEQEPLTTGTATVSTENGGQLNVRASTSTSAKRIDIIDNGSKVEVLAMSGDWAKIRFEKEGYVMSKFLKMS